MRSTDRPAEHPGQVDPGSFQEAVGHGGAGPRGLRTATGRRCFSVSATQAVEAQTIKGGGSHRPLGEQQEVGAAGGQQLVAGVAGVLGLEAVRAANHRQGRGKQLCRQRIIGRASGVRHEVDRAGKLGGSRAVQGGSPGQSSWPRIAEGGLAGQFL